MAVWMNTRVKYRQPQPGDREEFRKKVAQLYNQLNWFSFREQDAAPGPNNRTGCCSYQVDTYLQYGQKNGLSPNEYLDKVFNIGRVDNKPIVFIKAKWHPRICINVISQIGFGHGTLKIIGKTKKRRNFMLPPLGESEPVFVVTAEKIPTSLSFPWFMVNVVCRDQPSLCPEPMKKKYEHREPGEVTSDISGRRSLMEAFGKGHMLQGNNTSQMSDTLSDTKSILNNIETVLI